MENVARTPGRTFSGSVDACQFGAHFNLRREVVLRQDTNLALDHALTNLILIADLLPLLR